MKTQAEINREWTQGFQSNVGPIEMLCAPVRQTSLRKPYQYELEAKQARALVADVKALLRPFLPSLQHGALSTKAVSKGARLNLFILAFRPGYCVGPSESFGVTEKQWDNCIQPILARFRKSLGDDVPVYVEPWSAARKFQARFETYILFTELAP